MFKSFTIYLLALLSWSSSSLTIHSSQVPSNFFAIKVNDIWGKPYDLEYLKDKEITMIVNVACECRLTEPNYQVMVSIYDQWRNKGLEILGVPCNQFGGQEPGTPQQIYEKATKEYGVNFPLLQKLDVNGQKTHSLYAYLKKNSQLYDNTCGKTKDITWNFAKFVVNKQGKVIKYFQPDAPMKAVRSFIESQLKN